MSEHTVNMTDPSNIDGDSPSSAKCTGDRPCGNSSENECSGGYDGGCGNDDDNNDSSYTYPPTAPLPDNKDKIRKKCNLPNTNSGRSNTDPKMSLSPQDVLNETTKPWNATIKSSPQKPTVVNTKR